MRDENPAGVEKAESGQPGEGVRPTGRADFDRRELGALLRLFSSLGVTVAVGIAGFFWLGVWAERRLAGAGVALGAGPRIAGLLVGLGLAGYWAYYRIAGHLAEFDREKSSASDRQKTPAGKEETRR